MGLSRKRRVWDISQTYLTSEHFTPRVSRGTNVLGHVLRHPTVPSLSVCFHTPVTGAHHLPHTATHSTGEKCRLAQSFSFFRGAIFHSVISPGPKSVPRGHKDPPALFTQNSLTTAELTHALPPSSTLPAPLRRLASSLFLASHRDQCPSPSPNQLSIPGSQGSAGPG